MLICFEKAYFTITLDKTIFLNELIMHQPNESQLPNFTFLQILMHFQWHAPTLTTSLSLSTFFSPKQVKFNRRNVMGNNQTIQLHLIRKRIGKKLYNKLKLKLFLFYRCLKYSKNSLINFQFFFSGVFLSALICGRMCEHSKVETKE